MHKKTQKKTVHRIALDSYWTWLMLLVAFLFGATACNEDKKKENLSTYAEIEARYKTLEAAIEGEDVDAFLEHHDSSYLQHVMDLAKTSSAFQDFIESSRDIDVTFNILHMDIGEYRVSVSREVEYRYFDEASGSEEVIEKLPPWHPPELAVKELDEFFRNFDFWIKGADDVWRLEGNQIGQHPPVVESTADTSDPGIPVDPRIYPNPDDSDETMCIPEGFLEYDLVNYDVETRELHTRPVTTAFEHDLSYSADLLDQMRLTWFNAFMAHWATFGGFPFQSMTLRISNNHVMSFCGDGTALGMDMFPVPVDVTLRPLVSYYFSHEMFHAWNGGCLKIAETAGLGGPTVKWFQEGVTNYYAIRFSPFYHQMLRIHFSHYRHGIVFSEEGDRSLVDLGQLHIDSEFWDENVYYKGELAALLLDMQLTEQGRTLDDLMRVMYENHCLTDIPYDNDDIKAALATVGGEALADVFFDTYVYGNTTISLTIDDDFQFVERP